MTAIRKHVKDFVAIIVLFVLAIAVAAYILSQERFRFPLISPQPKELKAEFTTAQAVTPGQGQTVRISGVKVGEISKVDLKDGKAVVTMDIDEDYKNRIHTDAHMLLRPKTGLKDMFIEVDPGHGKVAPAGYTIPESQTEPDVNLDEILSVLDADTRDYLALLINGAGQGLKGRSNDLADVFKRFEPTHRDLGRLNSALAARRGDLRALVTELKQLSTALAQKRQDLAGLVDASAAVFRSLATEQANISQSVALLPGALRQTTSTLRKVQTFANILGPAANRLAPAVRPLTEANRALTHLARSETANVRDQIRPFVRAARPVVTSLRPAANSLRQSTPHLTSSFVVLNHLFNTLAYNPNGREGPDVTTRQEGFLFWLAWLNHDARTLFSGQDANGGFRPLYLELNCTTIAQIADGTVLGGTAGQLLTINPLLSNLLAAVNKLNLPVLPKEANLNDLLQTIGVCPKSSTAPSSGFPGQTP